MRLPLIGRRARLALALAALLAAAATALIATPLSLLAIATAAIILLLDRAALDRDLRALTAAILTDDSTSKLEVTDGAWGALCHALNRLRQQRRAQQQVAPLLPALPMACAARLADGGLPPDGLFCEVAVLAVGRAGAGDPIGQLRNYASAALLQAQLHEALLVRAGDRLLLIFGAMGQQSLAATLRAAQQAAAALAEALADEEGDGRPRLTLAAGPARAVALPGLGYSVFGHPVDQALALQPLARPSQLLCNEEAYLGLRRLGVLPPQPPAPRLPTPDQRPAYAVSF
jgi:class 3 adenylate cyclase